MNGLTEGQRLQIKSYFAATIQAAMEQATRELGPDALLLNSRPAPPEGRHLGDYEVVFGIDSSGPAPDHRAAGVPASQDIHRELTALRSRLDELQASYSHASFDSADPVHSELQSVLQGAGFDAELSEVIIRAVRKRIADENGPARSVRVMSRSRSSGSIACDAAALYRHLAAELEVRLEIAPQIPTQGERAHVIALVGPPGAGKTTTLVKLALSCSLTAARPIQLLSMDTCRIGAAEQLRSYAAIIGAGFQTVETPHALAQALEEHRNKGPVMIDLPGYSAAALEDARDIATYVAGNPAIDTYLVLPAYMRTRDLTGAIERFENFRPSKLIFTRLDETDCLGPIFCAAVRSGKPIAYLAAGQSIPEDLEPASKRSLIERILRDHLEVAESAA